MEPFKRVLLSGGLLKPPELISISILCPSPFPALFYIFKYLCNITMNGEKSKTKQNCNSIADSIMKLKRTLQIGISTAVEVGIGVEVGMQTMKRSYQEKCRYFLEQHNMVTIF